MKQNLLHIALTALTVAATSYIAVGQTSGSTKAKRQTVEPATAWTTLPPLGLREPAPIDTLLYNYFRESVRRQSAMHTPQPAISDVKA